MMLNLMSIIACYAGSRRQIMKLNFKRDINSKCPYESGDIQGQLRLEAAIEEWKRKYGTPYDSLMTYLQEEKGYKKERKLITHEDREFVTTFKLPKGYTGRIIEIHLPEDYKLGIFYGIDFQGAPWKDLSALHYRIRVADANNNEIDGATEIRIQSVSHSIGFINSNLSPPSYTIFYEGISSAYDPFKFKNAIEINKDKTQEYIVINPAINIENVEYYGTWDLWK
ncbi:MAG: hypothetical protein PHZ02_01425 [Desulfocapsaceae bacterium]|nr:hypothetical protein [Desulfocapsaceae bacterium]